MNNRINDIELLVRQDMEGLCVAHDFPHIDRVRKMAIRIVEKEGNGRKEIVEAGALLHEYLDEKFFSPEDVIAREQCVREKLASYGFSSEDIEHIVFIIQNVGFGKSLSRAVDFPYSIEMQIVEDADRLEAVGAIAIARTFAYGGKKGRKLYDGEVFERKIAQKEGYRSVDGSSIGHFYEKLLLLKDMFHTKSASDIAMERHEFMESFLTQFYREWNLSDV